jgi:hypothetical protein
MKKSCLWLVAGLLCGSALAQQVDPTRAKVPAKIAVRVDEQKPATVPNGVQQVALLSIKLDVVKGEVQTARVTSSKRIASYAPKVFVRRSGPWEVVIDGDTRRSFFVDSPARREAEAHRSSNDKYQWVDETGSIDWPLVVPLYADGRALGARSITIRDTRTGATILQTEM